MTKSASENVKVVPPTPESRRRLWIEALAAVSGVPRNEPLPEDRIKEIARNALAAAHLEEGNLGWAMVMVHNAFWLEQYLATPIAQRLFLLPRCLSGLDAAVARAQALGYRTLVADGSPIVVKMLTEERMEAVVGVGCLDSLDKAFNCVRSLAIPSVAVPLNRDGCRDTDVDDDFVLWFLENTGPAAAEQTRSFLPLLREAQAIFAPGTIDELIGKAADPAEPTARIAVEWIRRGGKRLRPFVTLAAWRAVAGPGAGAPPAAVQRAAVAIEALHKASLVHDDIEDGDQTRSGEPTIHAAHGVAAAINVGDFLLGLGYRLAIEAAQEVSDKAAAQMGRMLSDAHLRLCRGQGIELLPDAGSTADVEEVLRGYILKTSPAFDAAAAAGLIMAGGLEAHAARAADFCRYFGAAFQVHNDIDGWENDAAHGRRTAVLALALEKATESEKADLLKPAGPARLREIYDRTRTLERARRLFERLRTRAEEIAAGSDELGRLYRFLIDAGLRW